MTYEERQALRVMVSDLRLALTREALLAAGYRLCRECGRSLDDDPEGCWLCRNRARARERRAASLALRRCFRCGTRELHRGVYCDACRAADNERRRRLRARRRGVVLPD